MPLSRETGETGAGRKRGREDQREVTQEEGGHQERVCACERPSDEIVHMQVFCGLEAAQGLRTYPSEKISICHAREGSSCNGNLKDGEKQFFDDVENLAGSAWLVVANVEGARRQAIVNLELVTFVIFLLSMSGLSFQKDTERLIIRPLANMAKIVENLINNPLAKLDESVVEVDQKDKYETDFVEVALKKFVRLLQVAFGEAGSEIIGQNLGADGDLNPMVAGRKMSGIFGFAIVRNFVECTECLQEDVMVFVNTIADIVHRAAKENKGAPNKNIGSAFLLVWRLPRSS